MENKKLFEVGENYEITTTLFHCVAEIVEIGDSEIAIRPFRFDKDKSLKFHDGVKEPFPDSGIILGRHQIVKAQLWEP